MATTFERSAGVILYRIPPGAIEPEFLLLDYGRHWEYPKGHVEKGEDDRTAAKRELAEEAGITEVVLHDGFSRELEYFFRKPKKGLIRKTVVFFLGRTTPDAAIKLSHEHVGGEFLSFDRAIERLTYANAKQALTAAKEFLDTAGPV